MWAPRRGISILEKPKASTKRANEAERAKRLDAGTRRQTARSDELSIVGNHARLLRTTVCYAYIHSPLAFKACSCPIDRSYYDTVLYRWICATGKAVTIPYSSSLPFQYRNHRLIDRSLTPKRTRHYPPRCVSSVPADFQILVCPRRLVSPVRH